MEQEELKRKLFGLWEKTTHTSKDLLSVLFDYYFDINYVEYKENEGRIVSAVCGIPYEFGFGKNRLKALYLIALSAEEGVLKKGYLSELLERFNKRAKGEFDFTFLVPNTDLMADYYGTQGYFSSFFILEERFTSMHDFRNDYLLTLTDSDERIRELKKNLLEEIKVTKIDPKEIETRAQVIQFITDVEKKGMASVNLCHEVKDLDYLLNTDTIKNLQTFAAYDSEENITGVAITQKEDIKRTKVVAFYVSDICSYFALLDYIKNFNPDDSISVITSDTRYQNHSLIQQTYASANPAGGDLDNTISVVEIPFNINRLLQPLGMVKLLSYEKILEYIANTRSDIDFKLHIRDEHSGSPEDKARIYIAKNGNFSSETGDPKKDRNILSLSKKELSELLLRKNDSSNLIMEAFGIPRLDLQVRLLPC